jgi:hypothetical protein
MKDPAGLAEREAEHVDTAREGHASLEFCARLAARRRELFAHDAEKPPAQRETERRAALELFRRTRIGCYFGILRRQARAATAPAPELSSRAAKSPRVRERRDGSRRHSTRGGTDDDPDDSPEAPEPSSDAGRRFCACGCGRTLDGKKANAKVFENACQQRLGRATRAAAAEREDQLEQAVRWLTSLRSRADIATVHQAVANGTISGDTGAALVRLLLRGRLRELRGGRTGVVGRGGYTGLAFGDCGHTVVGRDEDGDEVCSHCGHYVSVGGHVNGYDETAARMASNGTYVHRRRPPAVWRTRLTSVPTESVAA